MRLFTEAKLSISTVIYDAMETESYTTMKKWRIEQ